MHKKDEEWIQGVIKDLQRMTSGNVSHIRDTAIGSLRSTIALSNERAYASLQAEAQKEKELNSTITIICEQLKKLHLPVDDDKHEVAYIIKRLYQLSTISAEIKDKVERKI
jgi:hypothetical protein